MLFNSYAFLLGFFPAVLIGFFLIGRLSHTLAAAWLTAASFFFYAYWSVAALPLLLASIVANYYLGHRVTPGSGAMRPSCRTMLLAAVTLNLGVLAYFKYADFFINNINAGMRAASGRELDLLNVVLPIGISFFTFTQIAFLVDCYEGKVRERSLLHYALFVSYFPHLISGPVLHHSQMMPQFRRSETYHLVIRNVFVGLFYVAIGLAKKALLADEFAQYASPVFDAARDGHEIGMVAAWIGAIAYTLQLYFDFSGYTDMAIGVSKILGIDLPINFNSPYKATSIVDFWRRWHITLSQFLRNYLYVRLGGNRRGAGRRYLNLMTTMLLGGLWHGASWTFVLWGALHGAYLLMNHAWRSLLPRFPMPGRLLASVGRLGGALLTFLCVVVAWVFFRATTFDGATRLLLAMVHATSGCIMECPMGAFKGATVPPTSTIYMTGFFLAGLAIVWFFPNSQELTHRLRGVKPASSWLYSGILMASIALLAMINASHHVSEFIYFNF